MNPVAEKIYKIGIIPVIAFNSVEEALPLCRALAAGGLPAAELTFRTECAEECIRLIHSEMPEMLLGAGTVLTKDQARRALAAGAQVIVSPGYDPEVVQYVLEHTHARPVELEVLAGNTPSISLYTARGFAVAGSYIGFMPGNESFPVTVYRMEKE